LAKITDATTLDGIWLGSKYNEKRSIISIPASSTAEEVGLLFLENIDGSGVLQGGIYVWGDSAGKLRYSATRPTDENADGTMLDNTTIGGAADKALSNLASVAFATDIVPDSDSARDIGSSTYYCAEGYFDKVLFNSTATLDGSSAGVVTLVGNLTGGASGTGSAFTFYATTAGGYLNWDDTANSNAGGLIFTDDAQLIFGDSSDFTAQWNAQDLVLDCKTDNTGKILIGSVKDTDFELHGATAGYDITWDASANTLTVLDDAMLAFGSSDDLYFKYVSGNTLSLLQGSSGVGSLLKGVDGKGIDETWYAETGSDYMKWDQDGASNLGALIFEDSVLQFAGATVTHSIAISTDTLAITGTDAANCKVTFGTTGTTNGMDVEFLSKTASDSVAFDAGAKTWTFTDVSPVMPDGDTFLFGSASGGDIKLSYDGTGNTLDVEQVTDGTGKVDFIDTPVLLTGADSAGVLLTIAGIDTTGNTDTVLIDHSGDGYAINIDLNEATSDGINVEAFTNHTVPLIRLDGDTAGFYGASNIGMLTIQNDIEQAHVNSSALVIDVGATKPKDGAEGYCLRVIDTSVVATTPPAYAVYIDSTANEGMAIETRAAAAKNLVLMGVAGQTDSMLYVDGTTGAGWDGATGVGQVHIKNDAAQAHVAASALYIDLAEAPIAACEGAAIHVIQSAGSAVTDGYLVNIEAVATGGALHVDGGISLFDEAVTMGATLGVTGAATFTAGVQASAVALSTAATNGTATPAGTTFVSVTSGGANEIIDLPTPVLGNVVYYMETGSTGYELAPQADTQYINNTLCSSAKELAIAGGELIRAVCVVGGSAGKWYVTQIPNTGTPTGAGTPD